MWVVASRQGLLSCSTTWPALLRLSRSLAMAGRVSVAAQTFELLALHRSHSSLPHAG